MCGLDQLLEHALAGSELRLDPGERALETQRRQRILVVEPGAERAEHQRDAARERAGIVLAQRELGRVHRRLDGLGIDPLAAQLLERLDDQRLDLVAVLVADALEPEGEIGLPDAVGEARPGEPLAEPGIDQRLPQRRRGRADEDRLEHVEREAGLGIVDFVNHPVDGDHGRLLARLRLARGIGLVHRLGLVPARLQRDLRLRIGALELAEIALEDVEPLRRIIVAVEHHARVRGMVVLLVEALEIVVGEVRDGLRVAARVHPIGGVRIERQLADLAQHRRRRRVGALHLVEHHALEHHRALGVVELVVPAFLPEGVLGDQREEHRVEIDVDEVVEVLEVLRRHRIGGLVRKRHGVEEGVERALDQLHERLLHRIFARPAEHRMLEDMRDAGRILGRGLEGDPEHLVLVLIDETEHLPPGPLVPIKLRQRPNLRNLLLANEFEGGMLGHGGLLGMDGRVVVT